MCFQWTQLMRRLCVRVWTIYSIHTIGECAHTILTSKIQFESSFTHTHTHTSRPPIAFDLDRFLWSLTRRRLHWERETDSGKFQQSHLYIHCKLQFTYLQFVHAIKHSMNERNESKRTNRSDDVEWVEWVHAAYICMKKSIKHVWKWQMNCTYGFHIELGNLYDGASRAAERKRASIVYRQRPQTIFRFFIFSFSLSCRLLSSSFFHHSTWRNQQ